MRFRFLKTAQTGAPFWVHIPGTPFTLPGSPTRYERLPGMVEWVPRDVVERVGMGLRKEVPAEQLAARESKQGLLSSLLTGGAAGSTAGLLAGRVAGGKEVSAPLRGLLEKGISKETLRAFSKIPTAGKVLPAAGLGAGLLGGLYHWQQGLGKRRRQAQEVAKGLLSEQILQRHALQQASQPQSPLRGLEAESASDVPPIAVLPGYTGV